MIYISNAFSINMLNMSGSVQFHRIPVEHVCDTLHDNDGAVISAIGHADTAAILSNIMGITVPMNRLSVTLNKGDYLMVCQYRGPRLPEGTTALPEGAAFDYWAVFLED